MADSNNNNIRKIVIATAVVTTLAGSTTGISGSADGTGTAALFNSPTGVITDGTNLYVTDTINFTIRKIVISSGSVTTFAGTAGIWGLVIVDGIGPVARFGNPTGITTDGTNLFIADGFNSSIRKIGIATQMVSSIANSPNSPFGGITGITVSGSKIYVTDSINHTIRVVN